jgi:hypothetical protein
MIFNITPLRTKQGNTIYVTEQTAMYCSKNDITLSESCSSDAHNQRLELLALLKLLPSINTFELRELCFAAPNPRLLELRTRHNIITRRIDAFDRAGLLHKRVGQYKYIGAIAPNNDGGVAV